MSALRTSTTGQYAGMLAIAAAGGAAFAFGVGPVAGVVVFAYLAAFASLLHFGRRRSQALEVAGGLGDERTQALNQRASAAVANVMAAVLPTWWLATVATGDVDDTLTAVCALFGATYLLAAAVIARRG